MAIDLTGYRLIIKDGIVVECVAPAAPTPPTPPAPAYAVISQRDPRWARAWLGNSTAETIGDYGCLLVCMAILAGVDPDVMNASLRANGGFQPQPRGSYMAYAGFDAALEKSSREIPGARPVTFVQMSKKWEWGVQPLAADLARLEDWIAVAKQPAILEVDSNLKKTGQQQHFVLALPGLWQAGNPIIIDPWDGMQQSLLPDYGKTLGDALYRVVAYKVGK